MRHEIFSGLTDSQLEACRGLFLKKKLRRGQRLFEAGRRANSVAVVLRGTLLATVNDHAVGRLLQGEVVGEAAGFQGKQRTATVRAACDSVVLILPAANIETLRSEFTSVYDRMLERGLLQLARRVQDTNRRVALNGSGEPGQPNRPQARELSDLWADVVSLAAPDLVPILRTFEGLQEVDEQVLAAIAQSADARRVPSGRPICLEGELGDTLFVLSSGRVRVLRNTRGGCSEELAVLEGPTVFGTGGLLLGERRNASCVVTDDGAAWVHALSADALLGLRGEAARVLRESLMASLRLQIRNAGQLLANIKDAAGTQPLTGGLKRASAGGRGS